MIYTTDYDLGNDRSALSSERAPHINKSANCLTVTKKSGLGPQMGLDTKTDWPTDRRF
jgi:hypothetical protein